MKRTQWQKQRRWKERSFAANYMSERLNKVLQNAPLGSGHTTEHMLSVLYGHIKTGHYVKDQGPDDWYAFQVRKFARDLQYNNAEKLCKVILIQGGPTGYVWEKERVWEVPAHLVLRRMSAYFARRAEVSSEVDKND